jgi:hypothetical protein
MYLSSVGIATMIQTGHPRNRGSIPGRGKIFSVLSNVQTGFGTLTQFNKIGIGGCFSGDKAARREGDYSPPSRADVKNGGAVRLRLGMVLY